MKDMLFICIKKNVWTNKWVQDPRNIFLQVNYYDPSVQYKKGWGSFQRKRRLTLCYNCRRSGHLAKECPSRIPSCICCKAMDYEVLDCPRMIAKVQNIRQENHEGGQETKTMEESQKESETVLLQMKEALNDHRDTNL